MKNQLLINYLILTIFITLFILSARMRKNNYELLILTYRHAWIKGANTSTKISNEKGNDNLTSEFKKDSLNFIKIVERHN
jgi:hypothetical protein